MNQNSLPLSSGSSASVLTHEERLQILVEWNATDATFPLDKPLHHWVEEQVHRTPDAIAVRFQDRFLTFRELNAQANQLAHHLRTLGVGLETLVGICVQRSLEMMPGYLAILKAGGAFVPLDPNDPPDRLAYLIADVGMPVLLTQGRVNAGLPQEHSAITIDLEAIWKTLGETSTENPHCEARGDNLAYVVYTSGSTGRPKAALNTHRGICNRLLWIQSTYPLAPDDRILQKTPLSFDVSIWELFWSLICGACLVVLPPEEHRDNCRVKERIIEYGITTIHFVASMLQLFLEEAGLENCRSLKRIITSGEAVPYALVERCLKTLPAKLYNLYGPTEAAIEVTYWECRTDYPEQRVPIGRPIANTQMYILDESLQPVPVGVTGELHIGGVNVARGYLNQPELTAEVFIPDPFRPAPNARLYKTGDLARFLPDGNIEFLGRADNQVKIAGVRIELGEIEAQLYHHPAIRECVVQALQHPSGTRHLVAYLTLKTEAKLSAAELRRFLQNNLPNSLIPSFVFLEALPLLSNGKVNRKALPMPSGERSELDTAFVAPLTPDEQKLAEIWARILGLRQVGRHDNFFALGGTSLLAARVFAEIEREWGKKLPLALLFQNGDIADLAQTLSDDSTIPMWRHLVALRPNGSRPPLFCIHGIGGNVVGYELLARYLPSEQPIYGLQSAGLDGQSLPALNLKETAAAYLREMREICPNGPYLLTGNSFGGILAYEMACQLAAQGGSVALVALLDASAPDKTRQRPLPQRLRYHWRRMRSLPSSERRMYFGNRVKSLFRRRAWLRWVAPANRVVETVMPSSAAMRHRIAYSRYTPTPYAGDVVLLRARTQPANSMVTPHLGWCDFVTGNLTVREVPGDHVTMMDEPHIAALATELESQLQKALAQER
jgi:amino acid adenylation domain-containing protein